MLRRRRGHTGLHVGRVDGGAVLHGHRGSCLGPGHAVEEGGGAEGGPEKGGLLGWHGGQRVVVVVVTEPVVMVPPPRQASFEGSSRSSPVRGRWSRSVDQRKRGGGWGRRKPIVSTSPWGCRRVGAVRQLAMPECEVHLVLLLRRGSAVSAAA